MAIFDVARVRPPRAPIPLRLLRAVRSTIAFLNEDAVDVIVRQHREIKRGFAKAMVPGGARRRNFERLVRLLAVHKAGQEAHLHPLAHRVLRSGGELAARRRAEEKEAKKMLVALVRTGPDGSGYLRALNELRRAVIRHAAREEREELPALRAMLSARRLRLLGAEMKLPRFYAPTRPHRWVNSEAANKLVAPVLGPWDRARDAVGGRFRA
jgi:hypothetical protein